MRGAALPIALALGGCWSGPVAFAPADDSGVVAPGTYSVRYVSHGPFPLNDDTVVLSRGAGGGLAFQDQDRTVSVVTVPADPALPGRYLVQARSGGRDATFALLDARAGRLRFATPACDQAARASGGVTRVGGDTCRWRDRTAMLAALRRWARTEPAFEMELVRE